MKKIAVIGYPIKHSLSPKLHGFWIDKYNIDAKYNALEISPDNFTKKVLLSSVEQGYVGFNVTIPHKQKALQIVDEVSDVAKQIGAVNTIYLRDGKLIGTNTDAYGFIENIKQNSSSFEFSGKTALLIGAGGAARSIIYGLLEENIDSILLVNRTFATAYNMQKEFGKRVSAHQLDDINSLIAKADLVINSTSLGMAGQRELEIDLSNLKNNALVTDIVYNPLHTKLLLNAKDNGNEIIDGLGMLLYQAVDGFNYWFNTKPEVDEELKQFVLKS